MNAADSTVLQLKIAIFNEKPTTAVTPIFSHSKIMENVVKKFYDQPKLEKR